MAGRRLLLVLPEYPPAIGGMQTHALHLSRRLAQRGWELEVLTYHPATAQEQAAARAEDDRAPHPVRRVLSRIGYHWNLDLVARSAARFRPAAIYSSTVFYGGLTERTGLPVICRSVGNDVLRPWIAWPYPLLSRALGYWRLERALFRLFRRLRYPAVIQRRYWQERRRLMREAACRASTVLANSAFTERLLLEVGVHPARIVRLVGGVDAGLFASPGLGRDAARAGLRLPLGARVITTACRLVDKKGVEFLIRTFAERRLGERGWRLCVVGDGHRRPRCVREAARLGVAGHVTFTGAVPHAEMRKVYAASDAVVLASRLEVDRVHGIVDAETMGRVLLESNAAGVPVVATDSGGIPSVVEDGVNGLLFRPDDADGLVACLDRVLAGGPAVAGMVSEGRRRAREWFDWSVITDVHEEVLQRHLASVPAGAARGTERPRVSGVFGEGACPRTVAT
jgi:glycosyltransferase involved in cell wall biosynthesis